MPRIISTKPTILVKLIPIPAIQYCGSMTYTDTFWYLFLVGYVSRTLLKKKILPFEDGVQQYNDQLVQGGTFLI